ncbi:MAG: ORF6N domain-containing protein [Bacteroidetes bacterium]|nr:ORF6N domain-containing protein [Bacteroidota bacterium]
MKKTIALADETVISKIYFIRSKKVMLDRDLAEMYSVETKRLNEQVRRNLKRFPPDFMFQLTEEESNSLRSQIATLEKGQGKHTKYLPYVFTEQGVAMLSSVLNSETAIEVNIQIIRIFTRMREILLTHKDVLIKLEQLEKNMVIQNEITKKHENEIQVIFKALKQLLNPTVPRKKIGYNVKED